MIYFQKLRYMNILSTGNVFTEVLLDKTKSTLIIGENGAGKTTILDALTYVLYGRAYRPITLPLLINSIINRNMLVEVEFRAEGTQYLVRRGMKPNIFEIHRNGVMMDLESANGDFQAYLEKDILKMNVKAFKQIVILGTTSYIPFMNLRSNERKVVIENLIDLHVVSIMSGLLRRELDLTNDQIRQITENIAVLKAELDVHQKYLAAHQTDKQNLIQQLEDQRHNLTEQVRLLQSEITAQLEVNAERATQIADHNRTDSLLTELRDIEKSITHRIGEYKKEIQFFQTNEVCPTCDQHIDEDFKVSTITTRAKQLTTLADGLGEVRQRVSSTDKRLQEIADICQQINETDSEIRDKRQQIHFTTQQLQDIQERIDNLLQVDSSNQNLQTIDVLSRAIRNETRVKDSLLQHKEVQEYANVFLKDTGIKAKMIKKFIPLINTLINKYLSQMGFFINFELDENFEETIKSPYRDKFSYQNFSEGEKLRINLAILFTWREIGQIRNSMSTNLLVMDEIFDSSLDDAGVEDFLKIIEQTHENTNIFMISHKSQMFDKFRGAIRFEKHGNFSRIAPDGA